MFREYSPVDSALYPDARIVFSAGIWYEHTR